MDDIPSAACTDPNTYLSTNHTSYGKKKLDALWPQFTVFGPEKKAFQPLDISDIDKADNRRCRFDLKERQLYNKKMTA
ncbi:hypothetical protein K1719_040191 [Acacia pycnantha]|nr:hypothetical protein K1719_040191 [Acacia pycnantha]